MRFQDRVVIVTGATSGIGWATVQAFFEEGARVALIARNEERLQERLQSLGDPERTLGFAQDVRDAEKAQKAVDQVMDRWGRIDVLVNNAGVTVDRFVMRLTEAEWDQVLEINLKGAFVYTKAVLRPMLRQRQGVIINVSSVVGFLGNVGQAAYSASKAGLIAFTRSVAREVGSRNIRVVAVAPGFVETPMTAGLPEEIRKRYLEQVALQRFAQPEEIARVILFLASEDAGYITGQTLVVDGGMI